MFNTDTCTAVTGELAFAKRGYRLIKKLNNGAFATVYLAEYTPNDESNQCITLACKVIDTQKLINEEILSRKFIHRELLILEKLNHPYLINVHKILKWTNSYYIFMPYAEKGDLLTYIQASKKMIPEEQCRIWFRQLSLGVQYIHQLEIAHRDIKCENILLTGEMNVKLADFGFARYVIDDFGMRVLSQTYCGSVYYNAPELHLNNPYDPKISDMWSMGVILFAMLNQLMPFKKLNPSLMYNQQINRKYKHRNRIAKSLSVQAKTLVANLLEPEVSRRWTVEQVVHCEWFAMDSQLIGLNFEEQEALNNAKIQCLKNREAIKNRQLNNELLFNNQEPHVDELPVVEKITEQESQNTPSNPRIPEDQPTINNSTNIS